MQRGRYRNLAALAGALAFTAGTAYAAAPLPPSTALPSGWAEVNLTTGSGNTSVAGTGPSAGWTMNVVGGDIQGKGDRGYFVYTALPGDGGIAARVASEVRSTPGDWMKTGVMLRQDTTPGSPMATINQATGQHGTEYLFRLKQDANAGAVQGAPFGHDTPQWLRAQRQGTTYQVLISDDGKRWRLIKTQTLAIDATKPVLAGLDGSTASDTITGTTTFDNVSVTADVVQPAPDGPANLQALPGNGEVLLTYNTVTNATGYNIYRRAAGETPDKAVLVNAKPNPYSWFVDTSPTNGADYDYTVRAVFGTGATATESLDSDTLGEPQVPFASGFRSMDISTLTPGSTTVDTNGVLTITASGGDIWDDHDRCRFMSVPRQGDYTLTAQINEKLGLAAGNTQPWAKAGVMVRASLDSHSPMACVVATTGNGVQFQWRTAYGDSSSLGNTGGTSTPKTTYPQWLRITVAGDTVSGFQSADGKTFTQIGKAITIHGLSADEATFAGLGATAHDEGKIVTAKFDAASIKFQ